MGSNPTLSAIFLTPVNVRFLQGRVRVLSKAFCFFCSRLTFLKTPT